MVRIRDRQKQLKYFFQHFLEKCTQNIQIFFLPFTYVLSYNGDAMNLKGLTCIGEGANTSINCICVMIRAISFKMQHCVSIIARFRAMSLGQLPSEHMKFLT